MPYFNDLAPWTYLGEETAKKLVAIGWLDLTYPFAQANAHADIIAKLEQFPIPAQASISFLGVDQCSLCQQTAKLTGYLIPGDGFLYVYPALLSHYMREHGYAPPEVFCEAVRNTPPFNSPEYLHLIKRHGPPSLVQHIQANHS